MTTIKTIFKIKKILTLTAAVLIALGGCEKAYDDSALRKELEAQAKRIAALEAWVATVNNNITSLEGLVTSLQNHRFITDVSEFSMPEPGGYYISFDTGAPITIKNGAKGDKGDAGDKGNKGDTGATPQIGIAQFPDNSGVYYWTLNGNWLPDDSGNKIPLTGENGATPQLRINPETNEWEICATGTCTDDANWSSTGVNATGQQGDAIFAANGVDASHSDYVEFTLADGETKIRVTKYSEAPRFLSFGFSASDNPAALLSDVACGIEENVVSALVPHILQSKKLIPRFTFKGASVFIGNKMQESGKDSVDFSSPIKYTVTSQTGQSKTYTVRVSAFTGLPVVFVNTTDQAPILTKDDYVTGDVRILGDMMTPVFSGTMRIKGRGNATWGYEKKPYRIKLDTKAEILGMPADKDWVLLAEYTDKSLLRSTYTFELSKLAGLPWTPRMRHVEFFRNGIYQGTYLLGEHVKVAKDRANVAKDGFLIELDNYWALEPLSFATSRGFHYTFKHPDPDDEISENDANYNYIRDLMNDFEAALYSTDFKNPETGYRKYIDVESFALWYLVQETLGNIDPNYYFALESRSGKLKLYPVWDSEWSIGLAAGTAGNWLWPPATSPVEQFYWRNHEVYYGQLFNDTDFVELVKEQWQHMKSEWLPALEKKIDDEKELIRYAQKENFERWLLLGKYISVGLVNFSTWEEETAYAKDFLKKRVAWLDTQINSW